MFTRNAQITLPCDAVTIHAGEPPADLNDLQIADNLWLSAVNGIDVDQQRDVTLCWNHPRATVFWATWYQGLLMYVGYDGPLRARPGDTITIHLPVTATAY